MKKYMKYLLMTCFMLIASLAMPMTISAMEKTIPDTKQCPSVVDEAGVMSADEVANLQSKLDSITQKRKMDISVVIVNTMAEYGYTDITPLADDWYDYNGYGAGSGRDGILLVVSLQDRKWAMSTHGKGEKKFTTSVLDSVEAEFRPELSAGSYYNGFVSFADACDKALKFPIGKYLLYALIAGIVIAFIVVSSMKSKLKSVAFQTGAADYKEANSLNVRNSNDFYLYSTVTRTAKPKESSSSHTSSSGSSHGGSSGSF